MIRIAVDCALEVHGEVGSKEVQQSADELVTQAKVCFDAGCDMVLVEAAEFAKNGEVDRAMLDGLIKGLDLSRVLFELPGWWIKGTTANDVFELQKLFVTELGPDANIANVQPDSVMSLEALRCGLSVIGPERLDRAAE